MKSYEEIMEIVKDNNIVYDRSYSIDNLVYIHFKGVWNMYKDRINKLFNNPYFMDIYDCVCVNMNEQPGKGKHYDQSSLRNKVADKKKRLQEIEGFELDDIYSDDKGNEFNINTGKPIF